MGTKPVEPRIGREEICRTSALPLLAQRSDVTGGSLAPPTPSLRAPAALTHPMAGSKQVSEFEIVLDGETYLWRLQRRPQWSSDIAGWRGMALGVRHKEGQREVVLEFPPGPAPRFGAPQLKPQQIPQKLIGKAIASAIAAGWEPLSRGKVVTIVVDATGD